MARWNDEMLDSLGDKVERIADKVERIADKVEANTNSIAELRENQSAILQAFVEEHEENRQLRLQYKKNQEEYQEWKRETDQRFNVLLEEVRASNRRIDRLEGQS